MSIQIDIRPGQTWAKLMQGVFKPNYDPMLGEIADSFQQDYIPQQFDSQGAFSGDFWEENAPMTIDLKKYVLGHDPGPIVEVLPLQRD